MGDPPRRPAVCARPAQCLGQPGLEVPGWRRRGDAAGRQPHASAIWTRELGRLGLVACRGRRWCADMRRTRRNNAGQAKRYRALPHPPRTSLAKRTVLETNLTLARAASPRKSTVVVRSSTAGAMALPRGQIAAICQGHLGRLEGLTSYRNAWQCNDERAA